MYGISKVMNLFNHTWGSSWFVWQLWNLIFIGILLGICYLLKPSSIVFLIAWTIIMGIKLLTTGKLYKKMFYHFL